MNQAEISQYITSTFEGVREVDAWGDLFYVYNPDNAHPDEFYFATLKNKDDDYDNASNLNRPDTFRLNIGIGKESFQALFPERPARPGAEGAFDPNYDFTAVDQLLPHPVYGRQYWICVVNPSDATFERLKPLLDEAYNLAVSKFNKRAAR